MLIGNYDFGILFAFFIVCFSSLFTIINPFSTVPIFLAITKSNTHEQKKKMIKKAVLTAGIVLIVFVFMGKYILSFFSISIEAFKIAGGILITKIGLGMINLTHHKNTPEEEEEATIKQDVSIVPLAIPMLSGPGSMTTSLVLMTKAEGFLQILMIVLAIIIVLIFAYIILSKAPKIESFLGVSGKNIADKIMGLIVLIVGIQFIINGVMDLLNSL
jgi:multiple antibiotic resistance protein